jgi:hypothetical protein
MLTLPLRTADLEGPAPGAEPEPRPAFDTPAPRRLRLSRYAATLPTLGLVTIVLGSAAIVATCVTITLDSMALVSVMAFLRQSVPRGTKIEERQSEGGLSRE